MNNLTIVMYHYVRDLSRSRYPGIKGLDLSDFRGQLAFLQANYNIVCVDTVLEALDGHTPLPPDAALLTFDDGYAEHFTTVFPILDGEGIRGAFFPSAAAIQENRVLDVNKIHLILASVADKRALMKELLSLLDQARGEHELEPNDNYVRRFAVANRFDPAEVNFIKRMLQMGLAEEPRHRIVDQLFQRFVGSDEAVISNELYMSHEQLRTMIRHGMHVGGHGHSHRWFSSLPPELQEREILLSLELLESVGANMSRWTTCYPYGDYDSTTLALLRKHGCRAGFTTMCRVADLERDDRLVLPRLDTNDIPMKASAHRGQRTVSAGRQS